MAVCGLGILSIDKGNDVNVDAKIAPIEDEDINPIIVEGKIVFINDIKPIIVEDEIVFINDGKINVASDGGEEIEKALSTDDEGSKLNVASGGSEDTEKALRTDDEDNKLNNASGGCEGTDKALVPVIDGIITKAIKEEESLVHKFELTKKQQFELDRQESTERFRQLQKLLKKSQIYSKYLTDKIKKANKKRAIKNESDDEEDDDSESLKDEKISETEPSETSHENSVRSKRRKLMPLQEANFNSKLNQNCVVVLKDVCKVGNLRSSVKENANKPIVPKIVNNGISSLFTGGTLRPYQIDGFNWMKALFENGLNGILGDEMGLGKTVQCIALFSHLIEKNVDGPFLVVAPLSTLPNWVAEFERFTPKIPVILYHGPKDTRRELMTKLKFKKIDSKIRTAPVIITSYEMALVDQFVMRKYSWKYIVVDEGHRIKNKDSKLITALKSLTSKNRLLLTGTPLQNDLSELWALLNFLLPELFHNLNIFESWFNISSMMQEGAEVEIVKQEQEKHIIRTLREILEPFLLRRVKQDVELDLPLKREYLLYVSLTAKQQEFYKAVVNKTIAQLVGKEKEKAEEDEIEIIGEFSNHMQTRSATSKFAVHTYDGPKMQDAVVKFSYKSRVMDLRKCVMHPYLIEYPIDMGTNGFLIDENLIQMSGKVMVLDLLLKNLLPNNHKVLIFSQMVEMLNILHDFCYLRNYKFCRLDGTHDLDSRKEEIARFNDDPETKIFLISTRAGGLGLNLMAADTVVLFDSDWNPQADLQAMARCHRIGQTQPVIVYRLVVGSTIDEQMLKRASAKRKLEKMIIHKDRKISKPNELPGFSTAELLELLKSEDHDRIVYTDQSEIFNKEELDFLLDRNFTNRAKNLKSETFRVEICDN